MLVQQKHLDSAAASGTASTCAAVRAIRVLHRLYSRHSPSWLSYHSHIVHWPPYISLPSSPLLYCSTKHTSLELSYTASIRTGPVMLSSTTNSLLVLASPNPVFPVPQPHHMTSNGPTLRPPSHSPQSSSGHSGPPSPMPSSLSLHNPPTASSSSLGCDKAAAQRKQIRDAWVDAEGEIPVTLVFSLC